MVTIIRIIAGSYHQMVVYVSNSSRLSFFFIISMDWQDDRTGLLPAGGHSLLSFIIILLQIINNNIVNDYSYTVSNQKETSNLHPETIWKPYLQWSSTHLSFNLKKHRFLTKKSSQHLKFTFVFNFGVSKKNLTTFLSKLLQFLIFWLEFCQ